MSTIPDIPSQPALGSLRQAYDPKAMSAANVVALSAAFPALKAWAEATSATFFEDPGALAPKDRERCIVTLLAYDGPGMSLAVHVYWGLMEGLSPLEVCQAVSLAGCYGGLPSCARGLLVTQRVMLLLSRCVEAGTCTPHQILDAIIREYQSNV
jgi:alkylhydroperoxidase/carboxymuconolactone decarboxylase family protein YurZ